MGDAPPPYSAPSGSSPGNPDPEPRSNPNEPIVHTLNDAPLAQFAQIHSIPVDRGDCASGVRGFESLPARISDSAFPDPWEADFCVSGILSERLSTGPPTLIVTDRWVHVAWSSTGEEGGGGHRPVAVGPFPGTADDRSPALHRNASDRGRRPHLGAPAACHRGHAPPCHVGDVSAYVASWLAQFLDDEPDRARFEAARKDRLLPVLGALPLLEVLDADRDDLLCRLTDVGGEGDTAFGCLGLILEDAIHELRAGILDVRAPAGSGGSGR